MVGGPFAPQQPISNQPQPAVPSYQDHKPGTAWNDPPMVVRKEKSKVITYYSTLFMPLYQKIGGILFVPLSICLSVCLHKLNMKT